MDQETQTQAVESNEKQDEADFSAGFDGAQETSALEPEKKVEPKEEPKVEAAPAQAAVEPEEFDPKRAFESITKTVNDLTDTVKKTVGRVGALQSAMDTAKNLSNKGSEAPSQEQVKQASASTEKWKRLQEDFPEWAEALDERFASLPSGKVDLDGLKKQLKDEFESSIGASALASREYARIDRKHDGWEETVNTPEFGAWLQTQTEEVRGLAASDKAADAIKLLDAFKEHAAKAAKQDKSKQSRLERSIAPKGDGGHAPAPALPDEEADFNTGFNKAGKKYA